MCRACEHRHVPPTGAQCPHKQLRSSPGKSTARAKRLASRQAKSSPSVASDYSIPCSGTVRCPYSSTGPGSSSEDESVSGDLFQACPMTSRGKRALPTLAPMLPPRFSLVKPSQSALSLQPDMATMILEQMQQMQAQNQREFTQLEQQGAADRLALQQALQAMNRAVVTPVTEGQAASGTNQLLNTITMDWHSTIY